MLLPFLLCILILYVPPPVGGMETPWPLVAAGVTALALLNAAAAWAGSGLAIRLADRPGIGGTLAANRIFTLLKGGVVGFVLADAFALRWPVVLGELLGSRPWAVFAYDVLLLLPALVMALTVMAFQHRYEWRRGRVGLPLGRYLMLRFRVELAVILVPWLGLVLATGAAGLAFRESPHADLADLIASGAVVAAVVVFGPLLLRVLWNCSRLPDGPLRERLEEFCRHHGFRCRDILVWHTHRHLANAGVVGPTPLLRYVMLTDALLEHCTEEEVEAIFAHEMGHVRHRHLAFYLALGLAFVCFYVNLVDVLAAVGWVDPLRSIASVGASPAQALVLLGFAAAYWGLFFGFVSRRMEQEADLFALRAVPRPGAFISALGKLAALSSAPRGASFWRHFGSGHRTRYLAGVLRRPARVRWFRLKVAAIKWGLLILLALGVARLLLVRPDLFAL
jgi:Zn-dependent protease with chaperone function